MQDKLKKYNTKRNFTKTNEPIGKKQKSTKKLRYCIQHHLARRDHYDLRLEWEGVLKSWAIPKGPSFNTQDKRLAIEVEDHPISYRTFEGTIPKGEYGGGTVMLFDEGTWEPLEPPNFKKIIKFKLKGKRLKGSWALIKYQDNNWLLIKEEDEFVNSKSLTFYKTSIKTGRTMTEIAKNIPPKTNVTDIKITNPDKVIYPRPKITKLDIIKYYESVAPRMLPYIKNRIISTIRCPEGITGSTFFKKHFENITKSLGHLKLKNTSSQKEDYYYIKDITGLLTEAQMNSIEFHTWGSTINNLEYPDILVFDLDPDPKISLKKIREGVKDLKSILDEFKLKSYLKTSGGKGYHVVVPLVTKTKWQEAREIANNIAKLMEAKWPEKYTSNIRKNKRDGKIFIDWVRNTRASTSVAPYSLRARQNAPVSMPISWSELDKIKPDGININEALKRLKKKDPWANFFTPD